MQAVPIGSNYTVPGTLKHRLNELLEHIVNLIDGAEKIVALANLPEITENRAHIPNRALPPRSISNPPKVTGRDKTRVELKNKLRDTEHDVIGIHGIPGAVRQLSRSMSASLKKGTTISTLLCGFMLLRILVWKAFTERCLRQLQG